MKIRTFLVDSDEATLRLLSLVARERGHEVVTLPEPMTCPLYTGSKKCCQRQTACGDLLLTDHNLPGLSGLDLIERQAAFGCKRKRQNTAILSPTWSEADLQRAERLACKVFRKPFLVREIDEWMQEREQRIRLRRQTALPASD